nr:hypothetical protein [uncultured Oscillibacter sp.]
MNKTKRNYIPFIAGMATMILLACLISASLAKEDPPAAQPQTEVQAGDLRLACSEAGIALFGVERAAPGEKVTAENGAELPAVLTYTDEKGEVHYYVEARTIADILDVCYGANYHEPLNCVNFGAKPFLKSDGTISVKPNGEQAWLTGDVKSDIGYHLRRDGDENDPLIGIAGANGSGPVPAPTAEEKAEKAKRAEEHKRETPLKPEYGITCGMYTEVDPAEVDLNSWSGTAMKGQKFRSQERPGYTGTAIEQSFAFTPYLGEYAVITIENTGTEDAWVHLRRPSTVGNRRYDAFSDVCIPAGQALARALRIDESLPLENRLDLYAVAFTDVDIELTLTAEQYRFGK